MNVLLVGYGKMGHYIAGALAHRPDIDALTVCDICPPTQVPENGLRFLRSLDGVRLSDFDAALIATPASSHADVAQRLLLGGIRHIYLEKPAVLTVDEFERVRAVASGCRIVTGYILRQSGVLPLFDSVRKSLEADGFVPVHCRVTYQKFLPALAEPRTLFDMGVFDEVVHVWDLIWNRLAFGRFPHRMTEKRVEKDPGRADRALHADLSYLFHLPHADMLLDVTASFRADTKKRCFSFLLRADDGSTRTLTADFDRDDGNDRLTLLGADGETLLCRNFPALEKLHRQFDNVFRYFANGSQDGLSTFDEAETIARLISEAKM